MLSLSPSLSLSPPPPCGVLPRCLLKITFDQSFSQSVGIIIESLASVVYWSNFSIEFSPILWSSWWVPKGSTRMVVCADSRRYRCWGDSWSHVCLPAREAEQLCWLEMQLASLPRGETFKHPDSLVHLRIFWITWERPDSFARSLHPEAKRGEKRMWHREKRKSRLYQEGVAVAMVPWRAPRMLMILTSVLLIIILVASIEHLLCAMCPMWSA